MRASRWLDRVPLRWWVIAAVAALLGISAVFGGLNEAERADDGPEVVSVAEEFVGPELATTVHSVEIDTAVTGRVGEAEEGNTYLAVSATVTNLWKVSSITFTDLLQLPWLGDDLAKAERVVYADGELGVQVNPNVPVDVVFIWEIPTELVPEDGIIPVTIMAKSFTEDGDVTYGSYWSSPEPAAVVELDATR
ncbi:hypothetical protein M2152_000801 [Microbacteriaceae bacterium SG_E_30_P1]|uniref:DUF4352 domain-containing protein n=1 Tax=Antiquaquibacter oligotrophicus TaxID=2880260 RepID=A0ABT6KL84_9MICO|nr:hypothetical protein [Antiquaquibacter oligotrophicus]MDH6180619.1 hypothetical protein [Antiquaquibacter oligotrophicus]UDF13648.1 hypothetical protein LH407_02005 [Antiquaquibacter oligotrophicus]